MLLHILVLLIIYGAIFGVVFYILGLFPIPQPFMLAIRAVLALIALILIIELLLPFAGGGVGCTRLIC